MPGWTRNSIYEKNLRQMFAENKIGPEESSKTIFNRYQGLWVGIREFTFCKHFDRIKRDFGTDTTSFLNVPAMIGTQAGKRKGKLVTILL